MYAAATAGAPERSRSMAAFVGGYALVWSAFGALAFVSTRGSTPRVSASPWLEEHDWAIGPSVLLLAGAFQFSSLKDACLRACRHPASFLRRHYRRGPARRLRRSARATASFCVGCCWALMLVMFAAGAANLIWMAALTGADGAREDPPDGRPHGAPDRRGAAGGRIDAAAVGGVRERGDVAARLHLTRAGRSATW